MKLTEAITLIEPAFLQKVTNTTWSDLGCGSGTFTKALAVLLGDGSKIYAVDKEDQHITSPKEHNTKIEFLKLDFIRQQLPFGDLDGIFMGNSLHYVKDKSAFIENIKKYVKHEGQIIIVEYDTEKQNPWVPYPINFDKLVKVFTAHGFHDIKKIGEKRSVYRTEKMYACAIKRR